MRPLLLLYVVALVVRLVLVALFPDPAYPDSFYYVNVARELARTGRLEVDFVWIFAEVGGRLPADPQLPIPSNAHWMPLASLVQVPFIAVLGETPWASALPFALIGSLAAPLAWLIARDGGASRLIAGAAGFLTAVPLLSLPFMTQPDNFSLFQPLAAASLWLGSRGLRGDSRAFVAAGALAGLAMLSRNDGLFIAGVLGLVVVWDRWRAWRSRGGRPPRIPALTAAAAALVFVAIVAPWLFRQLSTFGSISPSTASGKVLYIRTIEEWNSITTPATLEHFLGQGIGRLVESRIAGLLAALGIYATLVGGVLLAPFMLVGAWRRRKDVRFGPFFAYAVILVSFSALVSAVHVPGGTFIHSAVALAPHSYVLAVEGVSAATSWVAARRGTWHAPTASRVFVTSTLVVAALLAAGGTAAVHARWASEREERLQVARALDAAGAARDERVMSTDAAGYRYYTGRGGVVLVNDPLDAIEEVARAYRIRWLVIERDDAVSAVAPILAGERPPWIGAPIVEVGSDGEPPAVAAYPVCVAPDDGRCERRSSVQ